MTMSEMTDSIIFILSGDRKKLLYINDMFEKFFGIKKQTLYKSPSLWMKFLDPKDLKKLLRIKLKKGRRPLEIELNVLTKNNKLRWIKLNLYRIEEDNKIHFMGIIRDIDEKKKNDLKLKETNFRFKNVMANLPECIWIYSFEAKEYYVSRKIKEILGYSQEEFSNRKKIWEAIHPKYRSMIKKHWGRLIREKKLFDIEFLMKHKNGNYKWVRETIFHHFKRDNITYYEGIIRDINENKQTALIKDVIYQITTAIYNSNDLFSLCEKIHDNMNRLFNTSNIFFALYDDKTNVFTVPYELDQKDRIESFPAGKSLSAYVVKLNKPILLRSYQIEKLKEIGEINYIGSMAKIWIGVPLTYNHKTIGIISLQDYENENQFNEKDLDTLDLLSYQIAQSIVAKQTELRLKKSRENNFAILNAIPDLMLKVNIEGIFVDYKGQRFYRPPEEFIGKSLFDVLPKVLAQQTFDGVLKAINTNSIVNFEYELTKDDKTQYFDSRIVRVNDDTALSIVRNITAKKVAEMQIERTLIEKNSLLMEVHHRVKNNLTLLKSLLFLRAKASNNTEVKTVLDECQTRIHSMALVHQNLYEVDDASKVCLNIFIDELFSDLQDSILPKDTVLEGDVTGTTVHIDMTKAIFIGLVINELATNSVKYAKPENNRLCLGVNLDIESNKLTIEYSDNGQGVPSEISVDEKGGFGFKLIKIMMNQLDSEMRYSKSENISIFKFTIQT